MDDATTFEELIAQLEDAPQQPPGPDHLLGRTPRQISLAMLSAWRRDDPEGFDAIVDSLHGNGALIVAVCLEVADVAAELVCGSGDDDEFLLALARVRYSTSLIPSLELSTAWGLIEHLCYVGSRPLAGTLMHQVLCIWNRPKGEELLGGYPLLLALTQLASAALDQFAEVHDQDADDLLARNALAEAAD